MRLTQPFRTWQLAILVGGLFPTAALGQTIDSVTRSQALEPSDFPRDVVLVGTPPDGLTSAEWRAATQGAIRTWNEVSCSTAELRFGGVVNAPADVPERATAITFVDGVAEPCFAFDNDIGWTLLSPCGAWTSTAVLLNRNYTWSAAPEPYQATPTSVVDARSVITHELGHVLGIHHEDVADPLATMSPRYLLDGGLSTLAADDKLALCALHPRDRWECERTCGDRACVSWNDEPRGVCDEIRAQVGDYCDLAQLECATCAVTSPATYSGYCTAECLDDRDCPSDMRCREGQCAYDAVQPSESGCSSTGVVRPGWLLLFGVVALWRSRRRG